MIHGVKVIAVTPAGRTKFMALLAPYVRREHDRGLIDEWLVFDNCYTPEDSTYAAALVNLGPWVRYVPGIAPHASRKTALICQSYAHMTDRAAVYVRLDDDICYLDHNAIEQLVSYRIANQHPWIVYPTIFNNTRMSYMLQQAGTLPAEPKITNHFLDPIAWRDGAWAAKVHDVALFAARHTALGKCALPARQFGTGPGPGALDRNHGEGRISVNSYAVLGRDVVGLNVPWDEEGYMADVMPRQTGRGNAIAGGSAVVHFSYHCQPGLIEAGYLAQWTDICRRQT